MPLDVIVEYRECDGKEALSLQKKCIETTEVIDWSGSLTAWASAN